MLLSGCKPKAEVPTQFAETNTEATIYPDYKDIMVPPNIAPLNFLVKDSIATAFVAHLHSSKSEIIAASSANDYKDGLNPMEGFAYGEQRRRYFC